MRFKTSSFEIIPVAGDVAPNVRLFEFNAQRESSLQGLRGRIVVLELWATWCGPCQPAMDKLNALARKMPDGWRDKVVIAGLSVDEDVAFAQKHVDRRGWTHVRHYWGEADEWIH